MFGWLRRCTAAFVAVVMLEMGSLPLYAQSGSDSSSDGTPLADTGSMPTDAASTPGVSAAGYGQSVQFSGYTWLAKIASTPTGPGPNYFSDSPESVWVDDQGQLHLRLAQQADGLWYAAEVACTSTFGYGSYRFTIASPVDSLDPKVVLGLFTWNDDPAQNHRELDIEFGRFGAPADPPGRYTVQPYQQPANTFEFAQPPVAPSLQMFFWSPGAVAFQSQAAADGVPGGMIAQHTFNTGIPSPGGEHVRMNLWLDSGNPPTDWQPVEIIIQGFSFTPV
jgi:hypothetical protein